jgi:hypothetical protein
MVLLSSTVWNWNVNTFLHIKQFKLADDLFTGLKFLVEWPFKKNFSFSMFLLFWFSVSKCSLYYTTFGFISKSLLFCCVCFFLLFLSFHLFSYQESPTLNRWGVTTEVILISFLHPFSCCPLNLVCTLNKATLNERRNCFRSWLTAKWELIYLSVEADVQCVW